MNSVMVWFTLGALGSASAALVHRWSFDDNLLDTSGNGNNGTLNTGTETYVTGQFGNAISLTTGQAVDDFAATLGNATAANNDMTINLWLNLSANPASLAYVGGFGGRGDNGGSSARGILDFGVGDGDGFYFWGNSSDADSGAAYITDGAWHMYTTVLDFDGAGNLTYSFYIDGAGSFYAPVTVARTMVASTTEVGVGGTSFWGSTWAGAVDEFAVWDEALDATEVSNLFATNQTIPEPSVMALVGLGGLALLRRKRR